MSLKPLTVANCPHCKYEWYSRVKEPKACPRCKNRLDKLPKKFKWNYSKEVAK